MLERRTRALAGGRARGRLRGACRRPARAHLLRDVAPPDERTAAARRARGAAGRERRAPPVARGRGGGSRARRDPPRPHLARRAGAPRPSAPRARRRLAPRAPMHGRRLGRAGRERGAPRRADRRGDRAPRQVATRARVGAPRRRALPRGTLERGARAGAELRADPRLRARPRAPPLRPRRRRAPVVWARARARLPHAGLRAGRGGARLPPCARPGAAGRHAGGGRAGGEPARGAGSRRQLVGGGGGLASRRHARGGRGAAATRSGRAMNALTRALAALGLAACACATPPDLSGRHTLPELQPGDTDPALGYEEPPRVMAREILPDALRVGPHHRVTDPVVSDGFLDVFVIKSDFGRFEVAGDAMLRQRVGEIDGIAALSDAQRNTAFAPALARAARRPFIARWNLARQPSTSALGMPEAAWQELLAIDAMARAERSDEAQGALDSYLRFERARRRLAARLDVDEHAQNPVLQRELNRVALAMFAGGFPLSGVPLSEGAPPSSHRPFAADARLASLLSDDSAEDLRRVDRIELAVLGLSPELSARVLAHPWLTPRHLTIIVASLVAMDGAANRIALVEA